MSDLKPCPFCGGEAQHEHLENGRHSVGCADADGTCMGFQTLQTFATEREATDAWNTRASEAEVVRLQTVLGELVASIDKRWEHETQRKREAAISPRTEKALEAARAALSPVGGDRALEGAGR
jgi:reverse gyrase